MEIDEGEVGKGGRGGGEPAENGEARVTFGVVKSISRGRSPKKTFREDALLYPRKDEKILRACSGARETRPF